MHARNCVRWVLFVWIALAASMIGAGSALAGPPCPATLLKEMPARPVGAPTGRQFAAQIESQSGREREAAIEAQILAGNIPGFLRRLIHVTSEVTAANGRPPIQVTSCVLPDYLAVGSDRDFLFVPMRLATALEIGNRFGFTLPTAKLVDDIYSESSFHLAPQPLPASDEMRSTGYYQHHNQLIRKQETALGVLPGVLIAGHMKDLVLTNRLWRYPDRVAIYGWHTPDDRPIQPLSTVHGARYVDYSHGVRLVSTTVYVNGRAMSAFDALRDPDISQALSDEGPIQWPRRLVAARAIQPPDATPSGPVVSLGR